MLRMTFSAGGTLSVEVSPFSIRRTGTKYLILIFSGRSCRPFVAGFEVTGDSFTEEHALRPK
jgi:hypothetical protein